MDIESLHIGSRVIVYGARPVTGTVINFETDTNGKRVRCVVEVDGGSTMTCPPEELTLLTGE